MGATIDTIRAANLSAADAIDAPCAFCVDGPGRIYFPAGGRSACPFCDGTRRAKSRKLQRTASAYATGRSPYMNPWDDKAHAEVAAPANESPAAGRLGGARP